ncbi:MAG: hypothetical protein HZB39_20195 [Planctomycetes bacterium]|nr:hypothetical protein [Planctomycetota bacterium]
MSLSRRRVPSLARLTTALAVLTGLSVAQQRPLIDLSPGPSEHRDAVVSPNGQWIAYRNGNTLGVMAIGGQNPTVVYLGSGSGGFLWAASSASIYVAESGTLYATPRTGPSLTTLATFANTSVTLWDMDDLGLRLYCTRYQPSTSTYTVFELDASGAVPARDLFASQDELFGLRIDPTGRYLLHLQRAPAPFSPVSAHRTDLNTSTTTPLGPTSLGTVVRDPDWLDAGDNAIVSAQDVTGRISAIRVERIAQRVVPLTFGTLHQRTSRSLDGRHILCESVDGIGGNGPALLSIAGGGEILLYTREAFSWFGSPSIDAQSRYVVFSARRMSTTENARIFRLDLDREMRASPYVAIGFPITLELPATANEIGALFIGQRQSPFTLFMIQYDFDLGANFAMLTIAFGGANGIPMTLPIPYEPLFQGLAIDFQGFRYDNLTSAAHFTRSGRFFIF